jgi:hypothetical protein
MSMVAASGMIHQWSVRNEPKVRKAEVVLVEPMRLDDSMVGRNVIVHVTVGPRTRGRLAEIDRATGTLVVVSETNKVLVSLRAVTRLEIVEEVET